MKWKKQHYWRLWAVFKQPCKFWKIDWRRHLFRWKSRRCWENLRKVVKKNSLTDVKLLYEACLSYLDKWMKTFKKFQCLNWMNLDNIKECKLDDLLAFILYLKEKGIVDDVQLFDQYGNLKSCLPQKIVLTLS